MGVAPAAGDAPARLLLRCEAARGMVATAAQNFGEFPKTKFPDFAMASSPIVPGGRTTVMVSLH